MSTNSTIQWTNHTICFWWGCSKVSEACRHCYAETLASRFGEQVFGTAPEWGPGKPRAERLAKAIAEAAKLQRKAAKTQERTLVFVNSMSDWLDDEVPVHWLATLLQTFAACPDLTFQLLTKRPQNFCSRLEAVVLESSNHATEDWPHGGADIANFWLANSPPKNVWIGTTVEAQKNADTRIPDLLCIPARLRFLSCEPLLESLDLRRWLVQDHPPEPNISWLITGGESGPNARASHPAWFYALRDQCTAAHVPFFFKQWGEWLPSGPEAAHLPQDKTFKPDRFRDGLILLRTGVKLAGRKLQGREWNEYPPIP